MLIGELARATGLSRDTIRFYQRIGLMPAPVRSGAYARYGAPAMQRLARIQRLKRAGFLLEEIRALLDPRQAASACEALPQRLDQRLQALDAQIAELQAVRAEVALVRGACSGCCASVAGLPGCLPDGAA
ncbi:MerR family transcriptional regulator [Niveibacterium sp. SC-1]|uniref:MerR family transcriptional regulator n=1 Tax=Niveibacterium sp. SC-1 TaxID=3135646 RepID=UPI00311E29C5